ncbi:hypothetical protein CCHR01_13973 [Colletotrichum chrysophilum]|uniref:Uncharacterized protein n=1 Tax=Colletotrichum chrysophilum TaxID=1836956 RepID=A0AAD9A8E9_9PEZI|nr:hypothetical protein CCHR01_13973 [Colletotrichum chrysophilum]
MGGAPDKLVARWGSLDFHQISPRPLTQARPWNAPAAKPCPATSSPSSTPSPKPAVEKAFSLTPEKRGSRRSSPTTWRFSSLLVIAPQDPQGPSKRVSKPIASSETSSSSENTARVVQSSDQCLD